MPDVAQYIRCLSEPFTEVRDKETGKLVGCIPAVPESADMIMNASGKAFPIMVAMRVAVCVDMKNPAFGSLPGFVAIDVDTDIALPAPGTDGDPDEPTPPGEDPDLARAV